MEAVKLWIHFSYWTPDQEGGHTICHHTEGVVINDPRNEGHIGIEINREKTKGKVMRTPGGGLSNVDGSYSTLIISR